MGILTSTLYQGMALYFFVPSGLFDLLMLIKIWIERSLPAAQVTVTDDTTTNMRDMDPRTGSELRQFRYE